MDCLQLTVVLVSCRQWLSLLILLAGMLLSFGVLLTISERFFCPALELISEYLQLPPVVAGATLLSFGNGAPDIFTQVAAVAQVGEVCYSSNRMLISCPADDKRCSLQLITILLIWLLQHVYGPPTARHLSLSLAVEV